MEHTGTAPVGRAKAEDACVLIAEDDRVSRLMLQKSLQLCGFATVDMAENGQAAIAQLAMTAYDIVFMDCQMPVMDGYQATRQIRADEALRHSRRIPIVAMTGSVSTQERAACLQTGMDDHCAKPASVEQLQACLQKWFVFKATITPVVPAQSATDAPLDIDRLRQLALTAAEQRVLLTLFLSQGTHCLDEMGVANRTGALQPWRVLAHRLRGSAANLGMRRLEHLCRQAEYAMPEQAAERAVLMGQIAEDLRTFREWLAANI